MRVCVGIVVCVCWERVRANFLCSPKPDMVTPSVRLSLAARRLADICRICQRPTAHNWQHAAVAAVIVVKALPLSLCAFVCVCVCMRARGCVWQPLPQPPLTCQAVSQALLSLLLLLL